MFPSQPRLESKDATTLGVLAIQKLPPEIVHSCRQTSCCFLSGCPAWVWWLLAHLLFVECDSDGCPNHGSLILANNMLLCAPIRLNTVRTPPGKRVVRLLNAHLELAILVDATLSKFLPGFQQFPVFGDAINKPGSRGYPAALSKVSKSRPLMS